MEEDWTIVKKKQKPIKPKSKNVITEEPPVNRIIVEGNSTIQKSSYRTIKPEDEADIVPPKFFPFHIYSKIITARNKLGWSRRDLGVKANISEIKIANIENGLELYDSKLYNKLKKILDLK